MPTTFPASFKEELLKGKHVFESDNVAPATVADSFKVALFTSAATFDTDSTVYSTANEVATGNGYSAGGLEVTTQIEDVTVGGVKGKAVRFPDAQFQATPVNFTFRYALWYNDSEATKRIVAIHDFTSDQVASGNLFNVGPNPTNDMSPLILL